MTEITVKSIAIICVLVSCLVFPIVSTLPGIVIVRKLYSLWLQLYSWIPVINIFGCRHANASYKNLELFCLQINTFSYTGITMLCFATNKRGLSPASKTKGKRSDSVLWQKPLYPQKHRNMTEKLLKWRKILKTIKNPKRSKKMTNGKSNRFTLLFYLISWCVWL